MKTDVVVIGGGPAGMAAALCAHEKGASVVLVERDVRLGGILNQCIHAGFGLHYFGEELTGPEYADRFKKRVEQTDIKVLLECMVLNIGRDNVVTALCPSEGLVKIEAGAIVLAMGCRERTAGAIALPGSRPAGVYTAGMAQKVCNIEGYLVGRKVVILGSGDIGLIMARRMTLEGAKVELVLELQPYSSGLKRNIVQCLNDFSIPLEFSHTITRLVGKTRLEGLYYAPVDENRKPVLEEEKYIDCDCLLLSVGLIPENDLLVGTDVKMSKITSGALVDENRMTSVDGIFACGNVLHVHDLVDNVSHEAELAGASAAEYALKGKQEHSDAYYVKAIDGVRYALPQKIYGGKGEVQIFFRVGNVYKNCRLVVESNGETIFTRRAQIFTPGEMENVILDKSKIKGDVTLRLEAVK